MLLTQFLTSPPQSGLGPRLGSVGLRRENGRCLTVRSMEIEKGVGGLEMGRLYLYMKNYNVWRKHGQHHMTAEFDAFFSHNK